MAEPTIANWTQAQLVKFFQNMLKLHPPESAVNLTVDNVSITQQLTCLDQIQFMHSQTTVGAAGGASALPATPSGYIPILDYTGTVRVIPYYNAS